MITTVAITTAALTGSLNHWINHRNSAEPSDGAIYKFTPEGEAIHNILTAANYNGCWQAPETEMPESLFTFTDEEY